MQIDPGEFSAKLLSWYRRAKRTLPWREMAHDPYAVWISEIMLQQTTVAAAIAFFNRWMQRFPTVETLAESSMDDVLTYWAGLGYYSRARNIHTASKIIIQSYGGKLPNEAAELMSLPGIGRYTAGAISSIAFEHNEPVVDVNVRRILARVFGLESGADDREIWNLATSLMPCEHPGLYNQALMDLGATVCTPRSPKCQICPIHTLCVAGQSQIPEQFGTGPKAKVWRSAQHVCVAVLADGKVLLRQRRMDETLWAGLWELPRSVVENGESEEQAASRILTELGIVCAGEFNKFNTLRHVVTNNKIKLTCYTVSISVKNRQEFNAVGCRWVNGLEAADLALSSPQKRLVAKLSEAGLI